MKKIACVLGSPRQGGNSETIARKVLDTAESMGAHSQVFTLNSLNYKGCQGCMACKTTAQECVINDDLKAVLDAVREADVLVIAGPIYFGQVTAQLKGFIDRTYRWLGPDFKTDPKPGRLSPGKKCVFIATQGNPDSAALDIAPMFAMFLKRFGYEEVVSVRGLGLAGKTDAAANSELMAQAAEVGKQVMG